MTLPSECGQRTFQSECDNKADRFGDVRVIFKMCKRTANFLSKKGDQGRTPLAYLSMHVHESYTGVRFVDTVEVTTVVPRDRYVSGLCMGRQCVCA